MALNKVEICGVDTSKLPLLKEDEKKALFARIKQGDQEAKEEYIKGNLRLVLSESNVLEIVMKMWMICFRLAVWGLLRQLTTLTPNWMSSSPLMPFR